MFEELVKRLRFGELGDLVRRFLHADAGLGDVDRRQADEECEGRDDFEIDERLEREPADALHVVAVARDAHDERGEDQRHDQRFDHAEEDRRERLEFLGEFGIPVTKEDADRHRDQDPLRQRNWAQGCEHEGNDI